MTTPGAARPGARGDHGLTATSAAPVGPPAGPLRAFVAELARAGVGDAIVCPGSRSTPLALAIRMSGAIRVHVLLDERSAGYFALGLAKASRRPVAILVTSGTAAANLLPAVVEAREARVPLVVLTADRPPELRDRGSNQTIDQVHLYGRFARWYVELPVPEPAPGVDAHWRGVAGRAVATALEPPAGPVHVNLPFREPLVPEGSLGPEDGTTLGEPYLGLVPARRLPEPGDLDRLAGAIADAARPLVVVGPLDRPGFADALARLAEVADLPVFADGLANVRCGRHDRSRLVVRHDALLRVPGLRAARRPDLVVRFGATPTSKALIGYLAEAGAAGAVQLVVDDGAWNEPTLAPATIVR
ncbi:MAG TPA: 2-succinyl-5-enolpyruvyl-6-hydroxy-3-cyclohexene-1-carboxylic-acid synthase, partial [Candidatus Limnocylindrales bacterium]|nr:2-succinyl-5-enolpyruvyl-6-hydroxy-3-cyclohexene-1-carboxylic-acid synthase [Candidatus Limnocylindrales bacterium]